MISLRTDHAENYRRIGELWLLSDERSLKEEALVHTLDEVVDGPTSLRDLAALSALAQRDRQGVRELGSNAGLIDVLENTGLLFSPLLWDVSPKKLPP